MRIITAGEMSVGAAGRGGGRGRAAASQPGAGEAAVDSLREEVSRLAAQSQRYMRYARYAVRLLIGLLLGAIFGPSIQKGLALVSFKYLVPLSLATLALGLLTLAIGRIVRDLWRAGRVLRED